MKTADKIKLGNEIRNKTFKGNSHAQAAYFRELLEVLILERDGITPNSVQQAEIDKRVNEMKQINKLICSQIKTIPLEEMEEEVVE